jgi:hypothetical protein
VLGKLSVGGTINAISGSLRRWTAAMALACWRCDRVENETVIQLPHSCCQSERWIVSVGIRPSSLRMISKAAIVMARGRTGAVVEALGQRKMEALRKTLPPRDAAQKLAC